MTSVGEDTIRRKVDHLHDCVELLKQDIKRNNEMTEQIRDILATFRVTMNIAKWISAVAAAAVVFIAFLRSLKGG